MLSQIARGYPDVSSFRPDFGEAARSEVSGDSSPGDEETPSDPPSAALLRSGFILRSPGRVSGKREFS